MQLLLIALATATVTFAKPTPQLGFVVDVGRAALNAFGNIVSPILRNDFSKSDDGSYRYLVETSDGFQKQESGSVRNPGSDQESLAVQGHYSYVGDDGKTYDVTYTADEDGFHPAGDHIPEAAGVVKRPPPVGVPPACVASLCG